ncbi:MAG: hypothetical protein OES09_00025 [Gammaproteobacteria bacterium]|nr:hypothetical protein [Gammaproteobacteria bacterium]
MSDFDALVLYNWHKQNAAGTYTANKIVLTGDGVQCSVTEPSSGTYRINYSAHPFSAGDVVRIMGDTTPAQFPSISNFFHITAIFDANNFDVLDTASLTRPTFVRVHGEGTDLAFTAFISGGVVPVVETGLIQYEEEYFTTVSGAHGIQILTATGSGEYTIGRIKIGEYTEIALPRYSRSPLNVTWVDSSSTTRLWDGGIVSDDRTSHRQLDMTFLDLTDADATKLRTMTRDIGRRNDVFVDVYPTESDDRATEHRLLGRVMRWDGPSAWREELKNGTVIPHNRFSCTIEESV